MAKGTITITINKTITYDLATPNFDVETLVEQLIENGDTGVLGATEIKTAMDQIIRSDCDAEKSEITAADMKISVSDDAEIEIADSLDADEEDDEASVDEDEPAKHTP